MITNVQCRMARAALGWSIRDLASQADVSPNTISNFENGGTISRGTKLVLKETFERFGVRFDGNVCVCAPNGEVVEQGDDSND